MYTPVTPVYYIHVYHSGVRRDPNFMGMFAYCLPAQPRIWHILTAETAETGAYK